MNIVLLILSCVASAVFLIRYCDQGASVPKSVFKTLAVGPLAVIAATSNAPVLLTFGLAFGAIGDLALSRDGDRSFLIGLVAFALGHLAYIILFWFTGAVPLLNLPVVMFSALVAVLALVLIPRAGQMRMAVAIYVVIIGAMGVLALGLPSGNALAIAAAMLFAVSDALLGVSLFVLRPIWQHNWPLSAAIWTSYFLAQLLFLFAFVTVY